MQSMSVIGVALMTGIALVIGQRFTMRMNSYEKELLVGGLKRWKERKRNV